MKHFIIFIIVLSTISFTSSCKNENKETKAFLKVENNTIVESYGVCDGEGACGKINIEYPIFKDNDTVVDEKINSVITQSISSFYDAKTVKETSQRFISDFESFVKDFPESANNKWFVTFVYKVDSNTEDILTLSFYMEGYTGGAHGFRTITYTNFNPKTGEQLLLTDVVKDVDKLRLLARDMFIKDNNLDADKSLNSQGYWFLDDIFSLNNNFKISQEGITFHYNQYEIAPYSMGSVDVFIPSDKLKDLLK